MIIHDFNAVFMLLVWSSDFQGLNVYLFDYATNALNFKDTNKSSGDTKYANISRSYFTENSVENKY